MFVLEENPSTISWPVKVDVAQSGGTYKRMTFDAEFKVIDNEELQDLFNPEDGATKTDYEWAKQVVLGWSGIQDSKGDDIPFSVKNLKTLINKPGVSQAIADALIESRGKAKVKNS
tara:strand:- start:779 stop:1126 length:348 start_codon:yes stop_codon:yes gene_type:complete